MCQFEEFSLYRVNQLRDTCLLEHRGTPTLVRFWLPPVATVLLIIPLSSLPIVSITSRLTTFAELTAQEVVSAVQCSFSFPCLL